MSKTILGIDLGTTNTLAGVFLPTGPTVLAGSDGETTLPSVIALHPDGTIVIGREARDHAVEHPTHTIYSVKRLVGKTLDDVANDVGVLPYSIVAGPKNLACIAVGEQLLTPQELSAMLLGEIRRRAEDALGETITEAVITVPAYFDDAQRQATREAGRLAGLTVRRIVNEPTAAALAYGLDQKADATIAVYDLGGGTFDISILHVSEGVFQVLSTNGDTRLGGDDFDRALIDWIGEQMREEFPDGQAIRPEAFPPATRQALRNFAEAMKIQLSSEPLASIEIDLGEGRLFQRTITREEFETLIAELVEHTLEHCRQALADAKLTPADIDEVVMVGGSTRVPLVRERVGDCFEAVPYTALNPDEVVAMGAAVQAGVLAGASRDTLLLDVTPLSLGIETLGGAMGKLIMRNTTIPSSASETFTTYTDGQTSVDINIFQGERELIQDCRELGRFQLRGIPPMPAGAPRIKVTFIIDANGILNVSACEMRSGQAASVQVTPTYGLTANEIDTMVKDSYTHAMADMTEHRLIDLRNEAHRVLTAIDKALENAGQILTESQRAKLDAAVAHCQNVVRDSQDPNEVDAAMRAANDAATPLTQQQMDEVLTKAMKGRRADQLGHQIDIDGDVSV